MRKLEPSSNFFVISNYNTDPSELTHYCKDFVIYDQSNQPQIIKMLESKFGTKVKFVKHAGHNLTDYLDYIIENYDNLPESIAFIKGNIIGRHIEKQFFERIYRRNYYTFLFNDSKIKEISGIQHLTDPSNFIEINNSWFISKSNHRYFVTVNDCLNFFFKNVRQTKYVNFSPGGCYIVERQRILFYPKSLYVGLREIISYTFFPSEAWIIERILNTVYRNIYECEDYVFDTELLIEKIRNLPDLSDYDTRESTLSRIKRIFYSVSDIIKPRRT
jgi:hypothetical protein